MAGTVTGGRKAAAKNLAKDPYFYHKIGSKGGKNGTGGGFAKEIDCDCNEFPFQHFKKNCAGKKGGRKSRRKKAVE